MSKIVITLRPDVDLFFVGFCSPLYADLVTWCPDLDRAACAPSLSHAESQCECLRFIGFRDAVVRCLDA